MCKAEPARLSCGGAYKTPLTTTQGLSLSVTSQQGRHQYAGVLFLMQSKSEDYRLKLTPTPPRSPTKRNRGAIFDQRGVSESVSGGEQRSYLGESRKWFEMCCVGCWRSPCLALFCMWVPARQTPLIDAASRAFVIISVLYVLFL